MKKLFPAWSLLFTLLLTAFFSYCGYINTHKNKQTQTLKTITGSATTLNGITATLDTLLSNYNDSLTTSIALGEELKSVSSFEEGFATNRTHPNDSYNPYYIATEIKEEKRQEERTILYQTISKTIPFYFYDHSSESLSDSQEFPYIHVNTPDDMTLTRTGYTGGDNELYSYSHNYEFQVQESMPVTLNGTSYFTILGLNISLDYGKDITSVDLPYTIDNGIFRYMDGKIEKVYDLTTTNQMDTKILNLVSLSDKNKLGLIVKEGTTVKLQIINPSTKTLEQEHNLYEDNSTSYPDSSYLEHEEYAYYNASSGTLVVSYIHDEPVIPFKEFQALEARYAKEEDVKKSEQLYEHLNASCKRTTRLFCYTLKETNSLQKQMELDADTFSTTREYFYQAEDYVYQNKTLYLIGKDYTNSYYETPYLLAIKDNTVIYDGMLLTAANEDYACNRAAIENYKNQIDNEFISYIRQMSHFRLSLTK